VEFDIFAALVQCHRWSAEMDAIVVGAINDHADRRQLCPWNLRPGTVLKALEGAPRAELRRKSQFPGAPWDSEGPTDAGILCRVGMLHSYNDLALKALPFANVASALQISGRPQSRSAMWGPYLNQGPLTQPSSGRKLNRRSSTCLSFLIASLRGTLFLAPKQKMVEFAMQASVTKVKKADDDYDYPEDLPQILLNRPRALNAQVHPNAEERLRLSLFGQLYEELHFLDPSNLRLGYTHPMDDGQQRTFKVKFEGEGVDDYGGPYREIFTQLAQELQAPSKLGTKGECTLPLLQPSPNTITSSSEEKAQTFIARPAVTKRLYLEMYNFLGQLLGIAMRCKVNPRWDLPVVFWKSLVGQPLVLEDLKSFDAAIHSMIQEIKHLKQNIDRQRKQQRPVEGAISQLEQVLSGLNWIARLSDGSEIELCEDGKNRTVTLDNFEEFLDAVAHGRLHESAIALHAVRDGLCSVVPAAILPILTWEELQLHICGRQEINIDLLESNTEYDDDVSPKDPHIQCFWRVLRSFTEEEKAQFLRFVWARSRLPNSPEEFQQKFKIQAAVGEGARDNPDSFLPKAHTCFFSINLPKYSSDKVMAEKLHYAMYSCVEMDADFRLSETEMTGWDDLNNI